ncbi:MAG: hypothetical protein KGO03_12900, partial [Gemmatimonadota bacterium]|nr:hypothetical protein [Gemmatimonadota bacterium]
MDAKPAARRRRFLPGFLLLLAAAVYVAGWRQTEIDPVKLVTSLPKSRGILSDLIHPDVVTRPKRTATTAVVFPVPCGSA